MAPWPASARRPSRCRYYLLIVGSPERISFEFQYALDVHYAVGRIHFEGATAEETRLMYDALRPQRGRGRIRHLGTQARRGASSTRCQSAISASAVVARAAGHAAVRGDAPDGDEFGGWETAPVFKEVATRDKLLRLLGGSHRPTLLVAIGHGLEFRDGEQQFEDQGALLCSDFTTGEPLTRSDVRTARDIDDSATLLGMIVFMAVPYGAGTPKYSTPRNGERRQIAPRAFVSRLAQRLLSHPNGGALAVIGNVDMFWSSIFEQFEQGKGRAPLAIGGFDDLGQRGQPPVARTHRGLSDRTVQHPLHAGRIGAGGVHPQRLPQ